MSNIRPFKLTDLGYFLPNEFSNPDRVLRQLTDGYFEVQTMWHKGMVAAILCFQEYHPRCWHGFFLIAIDFPPRLAVQLRNHIRATMIEKDAIRLHTDSQACPVLDQWHEWLGFKWEGTREKMFYGKDFNMWALMRGGN